MYALSTLGTRLDTSHKTTPTQNCTLSGTDITSNVSVSVHPTDHCSANLPCTLIHLVLNRIVYPHIQHQGSSHPSEHLPLALIAPIAVLWTAALSNGEHRYEQFRVCRDEGFCEYILKEFKIYWVSLHNVGTILASCLIAWLLAFWNCRWVEKLLFLNYLHLILHTGWNEIVIDSIP